MIRIEISDREVTAALSRLDGLLADLTPVMQEIGEALVASTTDRFAAGVSPAGAPWAPKSPATLAKYARGQDRVDSRPLHGPSLTLSRTIFHQAGSRQVEVGSNRVYAAMMQFGGQKAAFPHLWGNIPARPFLGLSEEDRGAIIEIVAEWFARDSGGAR